MADPFNSRKHAIEFLRRRGLTNGTEDIGSTSYLIVKRQTKDDHEIAALRYLRANNLESSIDKCYIYRP